MNEQYIVEALRRLREFKEVSIEPKEMTGYLHLIGRSGLSEGFKLAYKRLVYQGDENRWRTCSTHQLDAIHNAGVHINSYLQGNIDEEQLRFELYDTKRVMGIDNTNLESQLEFDFGYDPNELEQKLDDSVDEMIIKLGGDPSRLSYARKLEIIKSSYYTGER